MKTLLFAVAFLATTFLQAQYKYQGAILSNIQDAEQGVFSPDGKFFYMPSRAGLNLYRADANTGQLSAHQIIKAGYGRVAISPDGKFAYLADSKAKFCIYSRDLATGVLKLIEEQPMSQLTGYSPNSSSIIRLSADGSAMLVELWIPSSTEKEGAVQPATLVLKRDAQTGKVSKPVLLTDEYSGVDEVQISPNGRFLYVENYKRVPLSVLEYHHQTGEISVVQTIQQTSNKLIEIGSRSRLTPDGKTFYKEWQIFDRELDNGWDFQNIQPPRQCKLALAQYRVDSNTGKLTFEKRHDNLEFMNEVLGGAIHRLCDFYCSPSGDYFVFIDQEYIIFAKRDVQTGNFTWEKTYHDKKFNGMLYGICFSPNGKFGYATAYDSNNIFLFGNPNGKPNPTIDDDNNHDNPEPKPINDQEEVINAQLHTTNLRYKMRLEYQLLQNTKVSIYIADNQGKIIKKHKIDSLQEAGDYEETIILSQSIPAGNYRVHIKTEHQDLALNLQLQ